MNHESDQVWQREEIASPCIKICVIQPETRLCTGCHRSIEEITAWSRMTPSAREAIIAELPSREAVLRKRRGGRAGRLSGG
ncbi:MAG: DUF1289 domain-containing protein [Pseudomonadota bacterium]